MRYAVVIEKAEKGFSGYVPDLPGCVAAGASVGVKSTPRPRRRSSSA